MPNALVGSRWSAGKLKFFSKSTGQDLLRLDPTADANQFVAERVTRVDVDSQNATLPLATLQAGLLVHTSATGGGTLTVDTGSNLDADTDWQINETRSCHYVNDGDQTVTLTGASGVTRVAATTIATLQGRRIVFLKTAATTYIVWAE